MTEPHDRLWCEWLGAWHDVDASKPKPSYEEWLEKRLEAAEKAMRLARSALDSLMGDSDLDGDNSREMQAMQALSAALKEEK